MKKLGITSVALAAAGMLVGAGPAQAVPDRSTAVAAADAGAATAQAARKPLRAERSTDIADTACGTSIDPPDGADSTVEVTHYNCTNTTLHLALTVSASDGSSTLTSECQQFLAGEAWFWSVTAADLSARRPTFIYRVAACA
jgi:hypothetical protein